MIEAFQSWLVLEMSIPSPVCCTLALMVIPTLEHLMIAAPVRSSKTAIADVVRLMNMSKHFITHIKSARGFFSTHYIVT